MQMILREKILSLYNLKTSKIVCSSGKKLSKPRIQKESQDKIIKNIRDLLKPEKENKAIKDKIINDIINLFELEKEDYYNR